MANLTVDAILRRLRTLVPANVAGQQSDAELLERFVRQHDEFAFTALVQRHGPMVLNVCRRSLRHAHDTEDAFQATFLVLAAKARSIRQPGSVASWLHGVAHRIAAHARAEASRRQVRPIEESVVSPVNYLDEVTSGELRAAVDDELRQLPEKYRAPLVLCYLEERTQEEAARELGWSKSTIRRRLTQGLELLRGRLTRRGATLTTGLLATLFTSKSGSAAVPACLVGSTVKAGMLVAVGTAAATAGVSAHVAALMEEGVKAMALSKLKLATFALLAVTLVAASAGLLANQVWPTEQPQVGPTERRKAAAEVRQPEPLPKGALARFGSARLRHGRPVTALRFSRDGKRLFSASEDFTVRVWDVVTGEELHLFMTGTSKINDIALVADGKQIAAATHKEGVIVFDGESGLRVRQLGGKEVHTVAVAPDGKTLFAGDPQGIHVWNLDGDKEGRKLTSAHIATRLVLSADGKWLAGIHAGSSSIQVIDWQNDKVQWSGSMRGGVAAIAFASTGRVVASAQVDRASELWRVDLSEPKKAPEHLDLRPLSHDQGITSLAFAPDGKTLYTAGTSQELRALDVESGKLRFAVKAGYGEEAIRSLTVSPDGKTIATGGGLRDHAIRLWDAESGQEQTLGLTANRSELFGLAVSTDGKIVAAGNASQRLTIWDGTTGRSLHEIDRPGADLQLCVAVSPDGKTVASSGLERVALWEVGTGKLLGELAGDARIHPVRFGPDGKHLFAGASNGNLYIWDVDSRKLIRTVKAHADEIWSLDVSPDGTMVATASFDQSAAVFHAHTGREMARRKDHQWYVRTIAFSPDGLRVATSGEGENAIFVWEVVTGELIHRLTPEWPATSVAWCEGGRVLVSAHFYDRLHFWDIATGKWLAMSRHRPGPHNWSMLASHDGRKVYTAGSDSAVLVWDVSQLVGELPPLVQVDLSAETLEAAWAALARRDPTDANRAVWQLAAGGDRTVRLLAGKLQPAKQEKVDETAIRRLIRELDDDRFAVREAASDQLSKSDPVALPILEKELHETESAERRARLERIIRCLKPTSTVGLLSPEELQAARAMQVLIYLNTPTSRNLLETIAQGKPDQFSTRQAKVALERMKRQ